MNPILSSLVLLGLFFIYVGWRTRQLKELREVSTARKREIVASIFTVIGSGEYIFIVTLFISYGILGQGYTFAMFTAVCIIAYKYEEIYSTLTSSQFSFRLDGYRNYMSPDYLYDKFGFTASIPATLITVVAFTALLWMQIVLGGEILARFGGINYQVGAIIIAATVGLYVTIGGFKAMLHTDVYQGALMWIGVLVAAAWVWFGGTDYNHWRIIIGDLFDKSIDHYGSSTTWTTWKGPVAISAFLSTTFAACSGPDLWQRSNIGRREDTVTDLVISAFFLLFFAAPMLVLTADAYATIDITESSAPFVDYLDTIFGSSSAWPLSVSVLMALGLLSAFVSTADTMALVVSGSAYNEWERWNHINGNSTVSENNNSDSSRKRNIDLHRTYINVIVIVVVLLGLLLSLYSQDIVEGFFFVISLLSAIGGPVFLSLFGFGNKSSVSTAIILGGIITIVISTWLTQYSGGYGGLLPFAPSILCFAESHG